MATVIYIIKAVAAIKGTVTLHLIIILVMHDHSRVIILSCIKIRPVNRLSLLGMPKCMRLCRHYSLFITYLLKNPPTIKLCQTKGFLGLVIDGQRLQRNLYWHDWSISESLLVTKAPWNIMNKLNDFDWFVEKQYKRRVTKRKDQLRVSETVNDIWRWDIRCNN